MFPNTASGFIAGTKDFSRTAGKLCPYKRRTAEQLTDRELLGKLCGAHTKGCRACECWEKCLYGQEFERRKKHAAVSAGGSGAGGAVRAAGAGSGERGK